MTVRTTFICVTSGVVTSGGKEDAIKLVWPTAEASNHIASKIVTLTVIRAKMAAGTRIAADGNDALVQPTRAISKRRLQAGGLCKQAACYLFITKTVKGKAGGANEKKGT